MSWLGHVEPHVGAAARNNHLKRPGIKVSMIIPVLSQREPSHAAIAADTQSFGSFLLEGRS